MDHIDVPLICSGIKESFKDLAKVLMAEMKEKAFATTDYETLRIEYAYLNKLVQRIDNEAFNKNNDTTGGE